MTDQQQTLEDILVAQVLTLARSMKTEERLKGRNSTNDYINEACREIKNKRQDILDKLNSVDW